VGRHLAFGWRSVLVFGAFGLGLETLHGFKIGLYLDLANETRRLMWTLAHAHGTLLGLVHVVFALSVGVLPALTPAREQLVSRCLIGATLLLPGGFFLGGIRFYAGDPGVGIVLVPVGAALLLTAVFLISHSVRASNRTR
jgi:hypothetical protein